MISLRGVAMASKDVGAGWGDLHGSMVAWYCPLEKLSYPVADWQIVLSEIRGVKMDGRKCPKCEFVAYQHHETRAMVPPVVVEKPKKAKKVNH